jgi:hypothetical protein
MLFDPGTRIAACGGRTRGWISSDDGVSIMVFGKLETKN